MNAKEAYGKWAEFDASRKGVLQEEAFAAGWQLAMERSKHILKTTYIIDEGEDYAQLVLERLNND